MKVEIIGPPGSGKSTLANQLVSILDQENVSVSLIQSIKPFNAKFLLSPPTLRLPSEIWVKFILMFCIFVL